MSQAFIQREANTIHGDAPLTIDSLAEQLAVCGLAAGQTVLVHSSMSKLGWIAGGAQAVIMALQRVLTVDGTLMMPAFSSHNTDPSLWRNPPVPESWWQLIRDNTPAYSPALTPTRGLGRIPELFRTYPDVKRSSHPITSFAAWGANADFLLSGQQLEDEFGVGSPLERLYELDGSILLLGVGHGNNTSLHLAETRANWAGKTRRREGAAMLVNGERHWVEFEALVIDDDDFPRLGDEYETVHPISRGRVGMAETRFLKQCPLVDWAAAWLERNRQDKA